MQGVRGKASKSKHGTQAVRRFAAMIILLVAAVFLFSYLDSFSTNKAYIDGKHAKVYDEDFELKVSKEYARLEGNDTVDIPFEAKKDKIGEVGLCFYCVRNDNRSGTISISIADGDGNVLAETETDAEPILKKRLLYFSFVESTGSACKVKVGETYLEFQFKSGARMVVENE